MTLQRENIIFEKKKLEKMRNENLSKVLNLDSSEFFCLIVSLRPSYIEVEDIFVWSNFHFKAKTFSRTHLLKTNMKKIAWDDNCISYYHVVVHI